MTGISIYIYLYVYPYTCTIEHISSICTYTCICMCIYNIVNIYFYNYMHILCISYIYICVCIYIYLYLYNFKTHIASYRDMLIEKDGQKNPCLYLQEVNSCIELHREIVNVFLNIAIFVFTCSHIHMYKDIRVASVCYRTPMCLSMYRTTYECC